MPKTKDSSRILYSYSLIPIYIFRKIWLDALTEWEKSYRSSNCDVFLDEILNLKTLLEKKQSSNAKVKRKAAGSRELLI